MILQMKLGSSLACCLSSLQTETWRAFWLSLSSLGTNFAEMRPVFKLSAKMCWTVPYDSPTISQKSWIVCLRSARTSSRTFAVFQCCVCRRSSRTLIDVDRYSSVLEVFVTKKILLWLMALPPKASCSIRWVSAFFFFLKIETKFVADSLLLKLGHSSCKQKIRRITKT